MKALIIRDPWIGLILTGRKTWELRASPTKIRGRIGLIRKGSGWIVGVADLVDSLPRLDADTLATSRSCRRRRHQP
jgi:ASCH domain